MRLQNMVEPSPCVTINQKFGMHSQYVTESDVASTEINVVAHLLMFVLYVRCQTCSVATNHINEWMKIRRRRRRHTHTQTHAPKKVHAQISNSIYYVRLCFGETNETKWKLRALAYAPHQLCHVMFSMLLLSLHFSWLFEANKRKSFFKIFAHRYAIDSDKNKAQRTK